MEHADREFAIKKRRHLHQFPELSFKEYKTAAFIRRTLDELGIPWQAVGETGTYGWLEGKGAGSQKVLLRADIDGLPVQENTGLPFASCHEGVMHACGHDIHTAALLAAAKRLTELRESFGGTVLLAFQQAEEQGHGAQLFREAGLTRGYDRAFGIHIAPDWPLGTVVLSEKADAPCCEFFRIRVTGKKSHISKPHQGKDALLAGAMLAGEIAKLSGRAINPADSVIVGLGLFRAGTSYNIVADEAVLEGTLRAYTKENQLILQEKIRELAAGTALLYGVEAECQFKLFAEPLENDPVVREEVAAMARQLLGEDKAVIVRQPAFGFAADDFSEFLQECPGVYAHLGVAAEDNPASREPLHSDRLAPKEEAVVIAADLHINYALKVLGQGF